MPTQIKICGISTVETARAAAESGADFVGFIHFERSPRHVELEALAPLVAAARPARTVLVTVNPSLELVRRASALALLDAIQLHGQESPDHVKEIAARFAGETWKAIPVMYEGDLDETRHYAPVVDRILYDAKTREGELPGGMGHSFDWTLLAEAHPPGRWGLAGGLDPDNVVEALSITRAPLADVSTGVESAPGVKDMDKIARFCQAVREFDANALTRSS